MNSTERTIAPGRPATLPLFYGALFRPSRTFRDWPMDASLYAGGWAIVIVSAIAALTTWAAGSDGLTLAFFTDFGWALLIWVVSGVTLFAVARAMRHQGEFGALMGATALAYLPGLFFGPLRVVSEWGALGQAIAGLGLFAVVLWTIRIYVAAVSGVTGLDTLKSLLAIVISQLLLFALPFVTLLLVIMGIAVSVS